jgi:hypothetical protein
VSKAQLNITIYSILCLSLTLILTAACQTQPGQVTVFIEVDGARQTLRTQAATVRDALAEVEVALNPLDRVQPDLYVALEPGLEIIVTRVREEVETEREVVPFERQTVVNEALAVGETRIAQLGANGEEEISYRVIYENDQEASRTEVSRVIVVQPVPEILVVGPRGDLPSVPILGTIAYLANGNAWLMRNSSGSRRAVVTEGSLDGRVFNLSPDGRQLIYTTELTNEIELPLNEMWLASTTIIGEAPTPLNVQGVLQAEWSPVVTHPLIAYTTAERTANAPGWRANNDLWLLDLTVARPRPTPVLPPNTAGLYPWWGTTFTWSPDGTKLAYARADQVGVVNLALTRTSSLTESVLPLKDFPPLQTFSDWVWVPSLSWSPDSQFIVATIHGAPLATEAAEESQVFDLWVMSTDGAISVKMAEQVGMWANPAWNRAGIAFGAAFDPLQSINSRYRIELMDRDGSNRRQIFPFREELGVQFPEVVWSPDGENLLFIYNGNLFTTSQAGGLPKQLTSDGQASHPQWTLAQPLSITETLALTNSATLTGSAALTSSSPLSGTTALTVTLTATPTLQITLTPTATRQPASTATPTTRLTATATRTPAATPTVLPAQTILPILPSQTPTATLEPGQILTATLPAVVPSATATP